MSKDTDLSKLKVNIKELDDQHQVIYETLDMLESALYSPSLVEEVLDDLDRLAKEHFAAEEKYMDMFNYENKEEHTEQHDIIKAKLESFKDDQQSEIYLNVELVDFLKEWIEDHIALHDLKYVECFRKNGLL